MSSSAIRLKPSKIRPVKVPMQVCGVSSLIEMAQLSSQPQLQIVSKLAEFCAMDGHNLPMMCHPSSA